MIGEVLARTEKASGVPCAEPRRSLHVPRSPKRSLHCLNFDLEFTKLSTPRKVQSLPWLNTLIHSCWVELGWL